MDPRDTPVEAKFRAEVKAWVSDNVAKYRDAFSATSDSHERLKISADWQSKFFTSGFGAIGWPVEFGGVEGTPQERFIASEESSTAGAPWHLNMSVTLGWCAPAINDYGTPAQKAKHLPPMLRGEEIWCQLFSEPNAGSDLASLGTFAEATEDGYVVNGQKIWSSGAHWSSYGVLVAKTDPDAKRYANLSYFICDMATAGVDVRPIKQITGEQDFCEVFFTDAQLAREALVGDVGMGWQIAVHTLLNERIGLSGGGGMQRLVNMIWTGLKDLASKHGDDLRVKQILGDLYVRTVCNKWTALRALDAIFKGRMPGPEASILKLGSDRWMQDAQQAGFDLLGLHAQLLADPNAIHGGQWANGMLYSRAFTIGGGTTEVQKNIVGERVLGLPR